MTPSPLHLLRRAPQSKSAYESIGGGSPIVSWTNAQAKAIASQLEGKGLSGTKCYVGMRYWHPFTEAALEAIEEDGINALVSLLFLFFLLCWGVCFLIESKGAFVVDLSTAVLDDYCCRNQGLLINLYNQPGNLDDGSAGMCSSGARGCICESPPPPGLHSSQSPHRQKRREELTRALSPVNQPLSFLSQVILPLYPQFSISTSGSSLRVLNEEFTRRPEQWGQKKVVHTVVPSYHDRPGYVNAMANLIATEVAEYTPEQRMEGVQVTNMYGGAARLSCVGLHPLGTCRWEKSEAACKDVAGKSQVMRPACGCMHARKHFLPEINRWREYSMRAHPKRQRKPLRQTSIVEIHSWPCST